MAGKSAVVCDLCGRTFKSSQGLAGHRRIRHEGVPPPTPSGREFAEKPSAPEPVERESIYKPYPTQPPQQPSQPVSPVVIKVETSRAEDELTKEGVEEGVRAIVREMIPKTRETPAEEPPEPEVGIETRLRQVFKGTHEGESGWGEVIAAVKESQEKIKEIFKKHPEDRKKEEESLGVIKEGLENVGETIEREVKKLYPKEVPKLAEQTLTLEQIEWQTKQIAEKVAVEKVRKALEEKTKREAEVKREKVGEHHEEGKSEESKKEEEEKEEKPEPPMSSGDTILMSKRLARETAARETKKLLDAKKVKKVGAEKKAEAREKGEEGEKGQKEGGREEEPRGETLEPPGEESHEEAPARRGIFPILRRRRFLR